MYESAIEEKMKKEIESEGGMFLKWVCPGVTGVPDRLALLPGGRIVFVEVKRPGGKLSARQKRVAYQLRALGFKVVCAASVEELKDGI